MSTYNQIKNNKIKLVIGAILVVVAVSIVFVWEFYGKEILTYREVPVLVSNIDRGTEIQVSDLKMIKVSETSLYKETVYNPNDLIGKESLIDIPAGEPLMMNYFINLKDDLDKGKFVFAVPTEWIYSMPQSTRRDDNVSFYSLAIPQDNEVSASLIKPQIINNTPVITTKVAYAKDASNHEVIDIKGERVDGSSNITSLEILVDRDQYKKLLKEVSIGNIFVITYQ